MTDKEATLQRLTAFNALLEADAQRDRDAARYRWLRNKLMKSLAGGVEVNDQKLVYDESLPGEEVRVYWYPTTPIGFYSASGHDLDSAIDAGIDCESAAEQ